MRGVPDPRPSLSLPAMGRPWRTLLFRLLWLLGVGGALVKSGGDPVDGTLVAVLLAVALHWLHGIVDGVL